MAKGMAIQFLDVGMGDSTFIQLPPWDAGPLMLVDFGEKWSPTKVAALDALQYLIRTITDNYKERAKDPNFKKDHPLPFLDYLVITHADADHWNKLDWLINGKVMLGRRVFKSDLWTEYSKGYWKSGTTLQVGTLIFGGSWSDYTKSARARATVIKNASLFSKDDLTNNYHGDPAKPYFVFKAAGERDVTIDILSANYPTKNASDVNSKSIVLRINYGGVSKAILAGDATAALEKYLVETVYKTQPMTLQTEVLKLSHHGSADSNLTIWLKAVQPNAVFACGDAKWGHPYCEAIDRATAIPSMKDESTQRRYVCAFNAASAKRDPTLLDYHNNVTKKRVYTNLWYVVKDDSFTGKDDDGKTITEKQGYYSGVQWEMYFIENETRVSRTPAWPVL